MNIRRVVPDINSNCMEESVRFYTDFLGMQLAMDMGWVATLISPSNVTAQINLLRVDKSPAVPPAVAVSFEVEDVDEMHAKAVAQGIPIVYPLTNEKWGVRRFHVNDPNGVLINVMMHSK